MTSYRERILAMEAPTPSPTGGAADVYFRGWYMGAGAAARLAAEADARIAELEAECTRLRRAMPDPDLLDYAAGQLSVASRNVHIASSTADQFRDTEDALTRTAAAIRAALATPAADAQGGAE